MKRRECKKIAQQIADLERIIETTDSEEVKYKAQNKILKICSSFTDLLDMMQVDEEVQKILKSS